MPRSTSGIVDGTTSGLLLEVDLTGAARGRQAEALADQLRRAVRTGTLPIGTRLPASRSLAADLGVSRGVVVRAYDQLVAEGYLAGRRGSGTIVAGGTDPGPPAPLRPVTRSSNPGLPSGGTFPRVEWARCAARALATLTDAELGYGDPAGLPHLREELARYLGRVRAVLAPPERVVVVNGFAQASRLVAEVLRGGGTTRIAVEDPGSIGLRDQFTASGLTCVAVPVDGEGMQVDALAASGVRAVVVTPAHQFPTGAVTSPPRRHALLEWARSCGGLVVEDDYDAEFRYDRSPIGALQGLGPDVVLYGGSVSKTLAPGVRLGWLVVPEHLVATYRDAKYTADLARGVLDQATFAELLASGEMDRHIRRMAVEYRRRRDHLVAAVTASLPGWEVTGAAAGLHLVLHPPGGDDEALARQAQACGLDARALSRYSLGSPRWPGLVVGYGHQPPARLTAAIEALARALNRQR
ncbi:MAG TPA: PLP-dependent aminotransferase family protein [Acidimicrobiales bacterium]|nr:PLP-dependent aminotransferase family protein [Acidimicrobiales bacterium]